MTAAQAAIEDAFAKAARHADEIMEHLALEKAGVLHADHHARQQQFERARRREIETGTDFAQVRHRRVGALRAGHAETGDQSLRIIEIVVANPGQRQIGKRDVIHRQLVEFDRIGRRVDRAFAGQHHAFRGASGARRIEND